MKRIFFFVFDQGNENVVLENVSQTSFETSNREAAKRQNLPKPLTKVPAAAEQPLPKDADCVMPVHCTVSIWFSGAAALLGADYVFLQP